MGEVSRGRSSEEVLETGQSEGLKNQKTDRLNNSKRIGEQYFETDERCYSTAAAIRAGDSKRLVDSNLITRTRDTSQAWAKEQQKVLNEDVMEKVLNRDNLQQAYKRVKANKGSAGVDGMKAEDFAEHAKKHWPAIAEKLKSGTYRPGAIRGIAIPKPQGGERILGIPNVQDRVIQQAISQVLSPIFEAEFSDHSYGYRPQRSAHNAVRAASRYVMEVKPG